MLPPSNSNMATAAALGGCSVLIYQLAQMGRREPHLPPGPPTLPILGNLHQLPKTRYEEQLAEWAKQYGEIYTLKRGNMTTVVLSSPEAVREMMEKNSALTAGRPHIHITHATTSGGKNMLVCQYNNDWRKLRRSAHEILTPNACANHAPVQRAESIQMLYEILNQPSAFFGTVRRNTISVMMSIIFGKRAPQLSTPEVAAFWKVVELWEVGLDPHAYTYVDPFPILKLLPTWLAPWKNICNEVKRQHIEIYFGLLREVEERRQRGGSNGCWMETVVERAEEWGMDRVLMAYLGNVLLEGGADTTASFLLFFIFFMVACPDVQKAAQKEIDTVVGPYRMPALEDMESLPYVRAVIQETLRMRPVLPLHYPHATVGDLNYKGYLIPSGAAIFVNCWGIFHDERLFENPFDFNPSRYLENKCGLRKEAENLTNIFNEDFAFGTGRRSCPGIHLAKNAISINVMNLLWSFSLNKAKDPETGKEIELNLNDYHSGMVTYPLPFACDIVPRSAQHAEMIKHHYEEATETFQKFEHELCDKDREFVQEQRKQWQ